MIPWKKQMALLDWHIFSYLNYLWGKSYEFIIYEFNTNSLCCLRNRFLVVNVQAVLSLCPVMRSCDKFINSEPCSYTHKEPVEWNEKNIFDQFIMSVFGTTDHVIIKVKEIAKN